MAGRPLEAQVRHEPTLSIIDLHGEIDGSLEADAVLKGAYAEATQGNAGVILLNFGDVAYINSTGLALIVALLARARKARRRLLAFGLSDHYRHIFDLTRLNEAIGVHATEAETLAAAAAG